MFSAAAAQLDRLAAVYEDISLDLGRAGRISDEYIAQLHLASAVEWSSAAAAAYRGSMGLLVTDGRFVQQEAAALAGEASIIAADFREWASIGRTLAAGLSVLAGIDLPGLAQEALIRRALNAVDDVTTLVSFIGDHGGVPPGLAIAVDEAASSRAV